jgi:hypothetical protein
VSLARRVGHDGVELRATDGAVPEPVGKSGGLQNPVTSSRDRQSLSSTALAKGSQLSGILQQVT